MCWNGRASEDFPMARRTTLTFTSADLDALGAERYEHPDPRVQQRMEVLWLISQGETQARCGRLAGVSQATAAPEEDGRRAPANPSRVPSRRTGTGAGAVAGGATKRVLRGRRSLRSGVILVLRLVPGADVRARGIGASAVQRIGGVERTHTGV